MSAPGVEWHQYKYAAIYNANTAPGINRSVGGRSFVGASMMEEKIANVLFSFGFEMVSEREVSGFPIGEVLGVRCSEELHAGWMGRHACAVTVLLEDIQTGKTLLTVQGSGGTKYGFGFHGAGYDCDEACDQAVAELTTFLSFNAVDPAG